MSQAGIICVPSFKRNSCYNISKLIPSNGIDDDFLVHILPFEDRLKVSLFGRQSKELRYQVLFWQIKHFIADIPKIFDKKVLGGYGFTENDEHPILVEFETFDGTKRAAPPEFLAAMILRENLKAVYAETGEKATSIAFCIFNDFTEKENQNIQKSLETACDLIRIKERCFVSWK